MTRRCTLAATSATSLQSNEGREKYSSSVPRLVLSLSKWGKQQRRATCYPQRRRSDAFFALQWRESPPPIIDCPGSQYLLIAAMATALKLPSAAAPLVRPDLLRAHSAGASRLSGKTAVFGDPAGRHRQ